MSPNKYSHALVLSYYESRGWITLPPSFPSPYVAPVYTTSGSDQVESIRYHEPIIKYHPPVASSSSSNMRKAGLVADPLPPRPLPPALVQVSSGNPKGQGGSNLVTYPSTPRSAPPSRVQFASSSSRVHSAPVAADPSTSPPFTTPSRVQPPGPMATSVHSSPSSKRQSLHRATPSTGSTITEIYDPDSCPEEESEQRSCQVSAPSPSKSRQVSNSTPSASPSHHRDSSYSCPSPSSTIFKLLDSEFESQDDFDLSPTLTTSGSSISSPSRTEVATPCSSISSVNQDSPILKPFDDFIPSLDALHRYMAADLPAIPAPWKDPPSSTTAPAIRRLQPLEISFHPALRTLSNDDDEDDAVPPPIARHRRLGVVAAKSKPDRSAMSFLKTSSSTCPSALDMTLAEKNVNSPVVPKPARSAMDFLNSSSAARPSPVMTMSEKNAKASMGPAGLLGSKPDRSAMDFLKSSSSPSSARPTPDYTLSEKKSMKEFNAVMLPGSDKNSKTSNPAVMLLGSEKNSKTTNPVGMLLGAEKKRSKAPTSPVVLLSSSGPDRLHGNNRSVLGEWIMGKKHDR